MPFTTSEHGQAAVAAVGLLVLVLLAALGAGVYLRASLLRQEIAGTADGAALAAAAVLRDRAGDLRPRRDAHTGRRLPPLLTRVELDRLARTAAARAARTGGAELVTLTTGDGARGVPLYAVAEVRAGASGLPRWLGGTRLRALGEAQARAGLDYPLAPDDPSRFRAVDLSGVAGVAAVIAAASAQLGWPYRWGGESRAEGGFDCSGLVDFALAAAGFGVGRPTAAGLQSLVRPVPLEAVAPGDLVFVGEPAHHVGLVVARGLAIEAPHSGAVVHYEPIADGGWTSAGRLAALAGAPSSSRSLPDWVPDRYGSDLLAASLEASLPAALLAAQIEAESAFDPAAVSPAGAVGLAQFMPATWRGTWNPWRARGPDDPAAAIHAQARFMRALVDRADGDLARALAAYHDGWDGSASRPWPPATRAYVSAILRRFGGSPSVAPSPALAGMANAAPGGPVLRLESLGRGTPKG